MKHKTLRNRRLSKNKNKQIMKLAEVTTSKYIDVRDKEQLYLIIKNADKKVIINIGARTYNKIEEMMGESSTIKEGKLEFKKHETSSNEKPKPKMAK
jgi:hypothetical protein